ncbi:hypothetical protein PQR71_41965 [Paraburkholderia fungorum]|uniref:hypothetical protein n=1 Tax=Paraburkholderia fungorum TaxID=134537 RepID=UPI0038BDE244
MTITRYGTSGMHREDGIFVLYGEYERMVAECERLRADAERLNYLDSRNDRKNVQNGTRYGWGLTENCNRIALEDHHFPVLTVREAIDAARVKTGIRDCAKCGVKNLPAGTYCKGIQCPLNPAMEKA